MVVIPSWDKQSGVSSVACFMQTRPKPAYRWQGLDWIVGPGFSFGVFSMSRFSPSLRSLVNDSKTLPDQQGGPIDLLDDPKT